MNYAVWGSYDTKEGKVFFFFTPPSSILKVSVPNKLTHSGNMRSSSVNNLFH